MKPLWGKISGGRYKSHIRYRHCIGHWMMVEGGGATVYDLAYTGNANNGSISGASWVNGLFGPALSFDASNDYVNCGSATDFDNISFMSVSAWIYPKSIGESIGNNNGGAIVCKGRTTNSWQLCLANVSGLQIAFTKTGSSVNVVRRSANSSITTGTWQHVAVTFVRSLTAANIKLYINGQETTYSSSVDGSGLLQSDASESILIGNNVTAALDQTFDGYIDDVRLYNQILTPDEVLSLYRNPFLEFHLTPFSLRTFLAQQGAVAALRRLLLGVGR